jgi:predicted transcriptional regulator
MGNPITNHHPNTPKWNNDKEGERRRMSCYKVQRQVEGIIDLLVKTFINHTWVEG